MTRGVENIWISFGNIPILKLYATQWFSREKIKWLLQIIWNMSWEFQRIKFKAPLNLFSIWNRSSCIFYFLAFWSILEISRNSRTLGESWRFRYFHIWEFSRIEKRIIWFIYFIFNNFSDIKNNERGNNMTFPKFRKNEDLINRSILVLPEFCLRFIWIGKNACFQKLLFRSRVKFTLFGSFLGVGENLLY